MQLVVFPSGPPPRPSPRAVRRFERLSRAGHRFHRFAHHPLCDGYAGDVIRIGKRTRICRGCALALAGGAAGVLAALASGGAPRVALCSVAVAAGLGAASLVARVPGGKLSTRFLPVALLAFAIVSGFLAWSLPGAVAGTAGLAAFAALSVAYRRRGPNRDACATCPERGAKTCSGFAPIVRRERALQRMTRRWFAGPHSAGESAA